MAFALAVLCVRARREVFALALVVMLGIAPIGYWFISAPEVTFGGGNF